MRIHRCSAPIQAPQLSLPPAAAHRPAVLPSPGSRHNARYCARFAQVPWMPGRALGQRDVLQAGENTRQAGRRIFLSPHAGKLCRFCRDTGPVSGIRRRRNAAKGCRAGGRVGLDCRRSGMLATHCLKGIEDNFHGALLFQIESLHSSSKHHAHAFSKRGLGSSAGMFHGFRALLPKQGGCVLTCVQTRLQ